MIKDVPYIEFNFPDQFPSYQRYPTHTVMVGLSRIGGLLSLLKLLSILLYSIHTARFLRRLLNYEKHLATTTQDDEVVNHTPVYKRNYINVTTTDDASVFMPEKQVVEPKKVKEIYSYEEFRRLVRRCSQ